MKYTGAANISKIANIGLYFHEQALGAIDLFYIQVLSNVFRKTTQFDENLIKHHATKRDSL